MIYNLAGGDITKINNILSLTADEVLTFLCYSKDLETIQ